jgi:hypothetical protein
MRSLPRAELREHFGETLGADVEVLADPSPQHRSGDVGIAALLLQLVQYVKYNALLAGQAIADIGYPVVVHRRAVYKDLGGRNVLDLLDDFFDTTLGRHPGHSGQEDANRRRLGDTGQRARELEQRFERLKLVTAALWQLLKANNGLTDEDLKRYIEKVDLADGKLDGKMDRKGSAMDCPGCNRRILRSAIVCPWCGQRAESGNAFEGM